MPDDPSSTRDLRQQMLPVGVVVAILMAVGGILWNLWAEKTDLVSKSNAAAILKLENRIEEHVASGPHRGADVIAREVVSERTGTLAVQITQLERLLTQRLDQIDRRLERLEGQSGRSRSASP